MPKLLDKQSPIQGLLRLHSRYGPPDRSAAHRRPLSRGSNPCGYPHKPLVSYRINRQLSGWILPPLMIIHENGILQGATRWVRMLQQRMVVLLPLLPGVSNALAARIVADQGLPAANSYRRPRHAVSPALRRRSIGCTIKKGVNR